VEIELRCICENDSRKLDEIKRLRAKALDWKKWPEEKPGKTDMYVTHDGDDWFRHMFLNGSWEPSQPEVKRWAKIPRPEGEK
jgi:hypothetical protein